MKAPALHHDSFGRLVLTLPTGETHEGVEPVRCFPLTEPHRRISFLDAAGREVFCLGDLAELPAQTRRVLEDDLARREFVPRIRRIVSVSGGSEPTTWEVETDRGRASFVLLTEDHVRPLRPHGVLVADSHGVRYLVSDLRELDAKSRRILQMYI